MEMYKNITTLVQPNGERQEDFEVKVEVHQGSQGLVLSHLLFSIVMDEYTKDAREGGVKELLFADDLLMIWCKDFLC